LILLISSDIIIRCIGRWRGRKIAFPMSIMPLASHRLIHEQKTTFISQLTANMVLVIELTKVKSSLMFLVVSKRLVRLYVYLVTIS
jgi:hypothetical protein